MLGRGKLFKQTKLPKSQKRTEGRVHIAVGKKQAWLTQAVFRSVFLPTHLIKRIARHKIPIKMRALPIQPRMLLTRIEVSVSPKLSGEGGLVLVGFFTHF